MWVIFENRHNEMIADSVDVEQAEVSRTLGQAIKYSSGTSSIQHWTGSGDYSVL